MELIISIRFVQQITNLLYNVVPCAEHEFQCTNGLCIDSNAQCDGVKDCLDGSDELKCPSCQAGTFQ